MKYKRKSYGVQAVEWIPGAYYPVGPFEGKKVYTDSSELEGLSGIHEGLRKDVNARLGLILTLDGWSFVYPGDFLVLTPRGLMVYGYKEFVSKFECL